MGNIFKVSILFLQKAPKNNKQGNMGHKSNRATKGCVKRGAGHKGNKRRRATRRTGEKGRTGEERDG